MVWRGAGKAGLLLTHGTVARAGMSGALGVAGIETVGVRSPVSRAWSQRLSTGDILALPSLLALRRCLLHGQCARKERKSSVDRQDSKSALLGLPQTSSKSHESRTDLARDNQILDNQDLVTRMSPLDQKKDEHTKDAKHLASPATAPL